MKRFLPNRIKLLTLFLAAALVAAACGGGGGGGSGKKTLFIGGIPDQEVSILETRFRGMATYLSEKTGVNVKYAPTVDYAAVVTAFKNGDVGLAWYGGLTGVQARLAVPGAQAIAQRPFDEEFHSVFIARKRAGVKTLQDLKGKNVTFGSASSTSGYLMPLFYLGQEGIKPDRDFKTVNFSGSHDKTIKLVEAGAFDAGALNAQVWERNVRDRTVDLGKVEVFWTTPAYYDYHWVARPDLDKTYGAGFTQKLRDALLSMKAADGEMEKEILAAFQSDQFIPTNNDNYKAIEAVARQLGLIGQR